VTTLDPHDYSDRLADDSRRAGQDEIDASKAPLMDHLIELRTRLIYALIAFVVMFLLCFAVAKPIYQVLVWPYVFAVGSPEKAKLIYTGPLEFFFTQIKVAMFGAAFFSFPIVATQIYKFVAPGLYKNERDAFRPYLFATPFFFFLGFFVVMVVAMPLLMRFSVSMQQLAGEGAAIELLPKVSEYLDLIMTLIFAFGITFQLPVVLTLLARAGLVDSAFLVEKRRWAILFVFVIAAVLTPPDIISQFALAIPTLLLYEVAIIAVRYVEKQRKRKEAETAQS
jgi:sec-independent protein translocase protein TatC